MTLKSLTTELPSHYDHLESMNAEEILLSINKEDRTVPGAVAKAIPQLILLVEQIAPRMKNGGRLFYIGAGTSGRLGIVDASECPPTYGVSPDLVIGLIAGGDSAIRRSVEKAEDSPDQAWKDMAPYQPNKNDSLIGLAASGRTPYVLGGINAAKNAGLLTGCIVCNSGSSIAAAANYPVEIVVGPEFVTGSTRMKAGTAQKLALNMLSTSIMILLGKVRGNKMVDMQLSNNKLVERAIRMVSAELNVDQKTAEQLISRYGNVREAVDAYRR